MRLDYFLAHSAGLTRKEAKQLISRGAVTVEGEARPKANLQLRDGQGVWLHGEPVQLPGHRYLMLHKPAGVVCSTDDTEHRTVLDLLPAELRQELLHVVNIFDPWARDRGEYYSLDWRPRADAASDPAFAKPSDER